jgi:hypothetical protein
MTTIVYVPTSPRGAAYCREFVLGGRNGAKAA